MHGARPGASSTAREAVPGKEASGRKQAEISCRCFCSALVHLSFQLVPSRRSATLQTTLRTLRSKKKGTKLHFKSPTAERRHVLCVGVGGDRTHAGPLQKSRVCPP
jgi:hypothetical protein